MSFWAKENEKKANGYLLYGGLASLVGLVLVGTGCSIKERVRTDNEIEAGLGAWGRLKEQNQDLYYSCLRELESK